MILLNLLSLVAMTSTPVTAKAFLLIISALGMAGCGYYYHSEPDREGRPVQSLAQTTVCCDSPEELTYRELASRVDLPILMDDQDPVYEFESGKSYVEAFSLPQSTTNALLQIDSLVGKQVVTEIPTVVFPMVTLVDSNFKEIVTLDQLSYEFDNSMLGQRKLRVVVTIDDRYTDVRYALIHTSEDRLPYSISTRKPYSIIQHSGFDTMLYDYPEKSRLPAGLFHRLRINYTGFT